MNYHKEVMEGKELKNIFKKNQLMITALAIMIAIAGYLQYAENTMDDKADAQGATTVDSGKVITENYTASNVEGKAGGNDLLDGILDLSEEDLLALKGGTSDAEEVGYENMDIASLDSDVNVVLEDYLEDGMDIVYANTDAQDSPASATPEDNEIPGEAVFTSGGASSMLADAKLLKEQTRAKNKETLMSVIGNEFLSDDQKQQAVNSMVEMTEIAEKETAAEILLEAKGFSDVVVSISGNGVDVVVNAISLTDAQRAQIEDIVRRKTGVSPENVIISTVVKD